MPRGGARPGAGRKRTKPQTQAGRSPAGAHTPSTPSSTLGPATIEKPVEQIENQHGLSPKELIFVECYTGISKFNASDAYARAGYKPNRHNAARLITKDNVERAIAERLGSRLRTLRMAGDEALEGISRIARADPRKVLTPGGNIKPIDEWDDETADALQSFKLVEQKRVGEGENAVVLYTKEFKFYDKLKARELMAKADGKLSDFAGLKNAKGEPLAPRRVIIELDDAQPGSGSGA